jgi:D-alanyl-D-alanine carboxypeptidase
MRKIYITIILALFFTACTVYATAIQNTFISLTKTYGLPLSKEVFCVNNSAGQIAAYDEKVRVIPASISKLYTFDFALATLGKDFRYTTNMVLNGDTLYINGGGDPHFVIENLRSIIIKVNNDQHVLISHFVFSPNFYFNWQQTPSAVISSMIASLKEDSGDPINPNFTVNYASSPYGGSGIKYQFQSAPLSILIKQINNYSTNISADVLFQRAGGSVAFATYMKKIYGVTSATVSFGTGSGLAHNYTTCNLTIRVMEHLEKTAQSFGISDIMSVPRIDPGVLQNTLLSLATTSGIVAKSGYLDYHHNYAGIAYTTSGPIYFAVFGGYTRLQDGTKTEQFVENFIGKLVSNFTQVPFAYTPNNDVPGNAKIVLK